METVLRWLQRYRPREGWLLWTLGLAAVLLTAFAANAAAWVAGLGWLLAATMTLGYAAAFGLSRAALRLEAASPRQSRSPARETPGQAGGRRRRQLPGWLAAGLLAALGLLIVSLLVGWGEAPQLPVGIRWYAAPWAKAGLALVEMGQRLAQWATDVRSGGAAQDDAVFRWLLGLVAWAAAGWAGWWLFKAQRPLAALLPAGLLLTLNAYFFWEGRYWLPLYLGLAALVTILANRQALEQKWDRQGMDYSVDVRMDVMLSAVAIGLLAMMAATAMPRIVLRPTAQWFDEIAAKPFDELARASRQLFPGLRRPPRELLATGGQAGGLPRAYLLGSGPELGQQLVMRVSTDELAGLAPGETPADDMRHYWRALTYDAYDGQGWRNSPVQDERRAAGEPWAEPAWPGRRPVRQTFVMQRGGDRAFYAAGEPLAINRPYDVLLRADSETPADDLVALTGNGRRYEVLSLAPAAGEEALRAASAEPAPPDIARRYQALPQAPARVGELARQVTAGAATPYDQALALEQFLRRFPYDLAVSPPPAKRDVVDYFLFDAQRGYCDYYASAMVVMARSLGIPARLAVGYATGDYDPDERAFLVHESNAHSWPELYFAGVGWTPFEPTGSRAPIARGGVGEERPPYSPGFPSADVQSGLAAMREEQAVQQRSRWLVAALLAFLLAFGFWLVRRRRPEPELVALYERLGGWGRRLGRPPGPGDTITEFGRGLSGWLQTLEGDGRAGRPASGEPASAGVEQFAAFLEAGLYGRQRDEPALEARRTWRWLAPALRRLWIRRSTGRK